MNESNPRSDDVEHHQHNNLNDQLGESSIQEQEKELSEEQRYNGEDHLSIFDNPPPVEDEEELPPNIDDDQSRNDEDDDQSRKEDGLVALLEADKGLEDDEPESPRQRALEDDSASPVNKDIKEAEYNYG